MKASIARLAAGVALLHSATAILVTSGSSCSQQCGNVLDATTSADIVCEESDLTSSTAVVLENCMNCELTSTYHNDDNVTDQQWLLYNSRYTLSECLWGEPEPLDLGDSPCITSRACGALQDAIQYGNLSTNSSIGPYDYCANWADSLFFTGCVNCLRASEQSFLANMVAMLQVGCDQRPQPGTTISIDGSIFSTTLMNETEPTPTSTWTNINNAGPLSLGAKVGIAIGALCLVLVLLGVCIVCNGRRRRRAFLRKLEMQHKDTSGWPHPPFRGGGAGGVGAGHGPYPGVVPRGPDMNETPLSQKPLRGWDDSPLSATASSDAGYARYFSPYSSQHTSPVNYYGGNGSNNHHQDASISMASALAAQQQQQHSGAFHDHPEDHNAAMTGAYGFPSAAQEKAMQDEHDAALAASGPVGLALGGDEPSLRSKVSGQSVAAEQQYGGDEYTNQHRHHNNTDTHNNANFESYELHEVSSSAGGSSAGGINNNSNVPPASAGSSNSFRNRVAREPNRAPVLQHPGYGRYSPERVLPPPPPPTHMMSGGQREGDVDNRI